MWDIYKTGKRFKGSGPKTPPASPAAPAAPAAPAGLAPTPVVKPTPTKPVETAAENKKVAEAEAADLRAKDHLKKLTEQRAVLNKALADLEQEERVALMKVEGSEGALKKEDRVGAKAADQGKGIEAMIAHHTAELLRLEELKKAEEAAGKKDATPPAKAPKGGIDLNEANLTINIQVDGEGIPLSAEFQDAAMVNIDGLTPVIVNITPLTTSNVPVLGELLHSAGSLRKVVFF